MDEANAAPLISVILPIYNVEPYLAKCLDSICSQSWLNWEVWCIDDGSADGTLALAQGYAGKEPRIHVLKQMHRGVSAARNLGLSHAGGDYVMFVDGDDWLEAEAFRTLLEAAQKNQADMVVCAARVMEDEAQAQGAETKWLWRELRPVPHIRYLKDKKSRWDILTDAGFWPFLWNKLIRRECLEQQNLRFSENLALGEDGLLIQLLCPSMKKVVFVPDPLYAYRWQRRDSATVSLGNENESRMREHLKVFRETLSFWSMHQSLDENAPYLLIWIWSFLYQHFVGLSGDAQKRAAENFHRIAQEYELQSYLQRIPRVSQAAFRDMDDEEKRRSGWNCWFRRMKYRIQNKLRLRAKEELYEIDM